MILPLLTILAGFAIAYASYLNYHGRLFPEKRGLHHMGPGMTRAINYDGVAANVHFIRTGER